MNIGGNLQGYKGKSMLDAGFVFAPRPPIFWEDDVDCTELRDLVYLHIRESLPKDVLPATYSLSTSWALGKAKDCIHVTMYNCRTLILMPFAGHKLMVLFLDEDQRPMNQERPVKPGGWSIQAEDPAFLDKLDALLLEWFHSERERLMTEGTRKDKKRKKRNACKNQKFSIY